MNLQSNTVTVNKPVQEVFDFLSAVENYEQIMPENTEKFEAGEDSFLFSLKGMPEIRLKMQESFSNDRVVLGSTSDKFPFTLTGQIKSLDEQSSEVQLLFDGKFNAMMSMMIKPPLQKFINNLIANIEKI